jgi:hypothetical protein
MKIYQLHECGGEWEDHFDRIIASYVSKDKAIEGKRISEELERQQREHHELCSNCPFIDEDLNNLETILEDYKDYCDKAHFASDSDYIRCTNYFYKCDDISFYIQEIEVIE